MLVNPFAKDQDWFKDKKECMKLLDDFGVGVAIINPHMEIIAMNKVMKRWFPAVDVNKQPICYKSFNVPPRNVTCSYCPTIKALADGKIHEAVTETPAGDNRIVNYRVVSSPVIDDKGQVIAAVEVVEDVTDIKKSSKRINSLYECFLAFGANPDENIRRLTRLCGGLLGATAALYNRLEGDMLCALGQWHTPPDFKKKDMAEGHICFDAIKGEIGNLLIVRNLQQSKYAASDPNVKKYNLQTYIGKAVACRGANIGSLCAIYQKDLVPSEEDKKTLEIIAASICIEEDRRLRAEDLRLSEDKYRTLFEGANDAIFIADAKTGMIIDANRQAERLLGRSREDILKMHQAQLHPTDEEERYKEMFRQHIAQTNTTENTEAEIVSKDGVKIPVLISASVQEIGGRRIVQGMFRDISHLKRIEGEKKEAEALALIDPHTQLYNYRYLQRRIHSEFELAKRRATPLSVLMVDIDYFKSVNDTYGHEFGDTVLQEFAILLQHTCRGIDVVTRFEGEGFAIILPDTDGKGAFVFAERIQRMIKKHRFGAYKVRLRVSTGISTYPEDGMATVDGLLTNVDRCIRMAKEQGGDTITMASQLKKTGAAPIPIDRDSQKRVNDITKKFLDLLHRNKQNTIEAVYALAHTVGAKNAYTEAHSEDMVKYSTEIARKLGLSDEELDDIKHGAMLHDIGKLGISEKILMKRGKLTKKEFEVIRKHPQIGADIIRPVHFLKNVVPIILHHHERYDGYGYGSKLKGDEIPVGARVVAIVDVYQALVSNRPYRKAYSRRDAIKIIKEESGTHFDPKIVKIFLEILTKEKQKKRRV